MPPSDRSGRRSALTNPEEYEGGNLQYFQGTQDEGLEILKTGNQLPDDRVKGVGRQRRGWGVFMQGSRVFHQVTALLSGHRRTTVIFSFQPYNVLSPEACPRLSESFFLTDPHHIFLPDWVRYWAWKTGRRAEMYLEHAASAAQEGFADTNLHKSASDFAAAMRDIWTNLPYTKDPAVLTAGLAAALQAFEPVVQEAVAATGEGTGGEDTFLGVAERYGKSNLLTGLEEANRCVEEVRQSSSSAQCGMIFF